MVHSAVSRGVISVFDTFSTLSRAIPLSRNPNCTLIRNPAVRDTSIATPNKTHHQHRGIILIADHIDSIPDQIVLTAKVIVLSNPGIAPGISPSDLIDRGFDAALAPTIASTDQIAAGFAPIV